MCYIYVYGNRILWIHQYSWASNFVNLSKPTISLTHNFVKSNCMFFLNDQELYFGITMQITKFGTQRKPDTTTYCCSVSRYLITRGFCDPNSSWSSSAMNIMVSTCMFSCIYTDTMWLYFTASLSSEWS